MVVLLAEELALLALDGEGRVVDGGSVLPAVSMAITGALILELQQVGHVELDDDLVVHLTGSRPVHPALATELERLVPLEGRRLGTRLARTRHAGWDEVVDELVVRSVLRRDDRRFRQPTFPPVDPAGHAALVARVQAAAIARDGPDERTTTLLAFVAAAGLGRVAVAHRATAPGVRRRLEAALDQVPLARLSRDAFGANKALFWVGSNRGAPGGI